MSADARFTRRDALKRLGVASGVAWTAPKLTSRAAPAAGTPAPGRTIDLAGSASGTTIPLTGTRCPNSGNQFEADSNGTFFPSGLGAWTYSVDYCVTVGPVVDFTAGIFTLTAADGTLRGAMSGSATPRGDGQRLDAHWVLTIQSGTGRFAGARGTITFDGVMMPTIRDSFTVRGAVQVPA
jgi:hypothetical protein